MQSLGPEERESIVEIEEPVAGHFRRMSTNDDTLIRVTSHTGENRLYNWSGTICAFVLQPKRNLK